MTRHVHIYTYTGTSFAISLHCNCNKNNLYWIEHDRIISIMDVFLFVSGCMCAIKRPEICVLL